MRVWLRATSGMFVDFVMKNVSVKIPIRNLIWLLIEQRTTKWIKDLISKNPWQLGPTEDTYDEYSFSHAKINKSSSKIDRLDFPKGSPD